MDTDVLKIIPIVVGVIVLFGLWYFLRKLERRNTVLTVDEATLEWQDVRCVKCNKAMKKGYSFAGKGITWVPRYAKKPGAFSSIGSVLENTLSLRIPPAINMAWYCQGCKIVVFDNSKMLKIGRS